MRVNPFWLPLLVIVALLGTVGIAQVAGAWTTSGRTAIDYANMTPDDLKGWMTLQQVMSGLKISQADLYALANIPGDVPTSTALKDLEEIVPDFEVTALREALNEKLGSAAPEGETPPASETSAPTVVPQATGAAEPIIVPQATAIAEPTATPQAQATVHASPTPLPQGQVLPASEIKGRMTLAEVSAQCAVPLDKLLAALNLPPDTNPQTALKDLVSAGKIPEVSAVQVAVAELQK